MGCCCDTPQPAGCPFCESQLPAYLDLTMSGWTNGSCTRCSSLNVTNLRLYKVVGSLYNVCRYGGTSIPGTCAVFDSYGLTGAFVQLVWDSNFPAATKIHLVVTTQWVGYVNSWLFQSANIGYGTAQDCYELRGTTWDCWFTSLFKTGPTMCFYPPVDPPYVTFSST